MEKPIWNVCPGDATCVHVDGVAQPMRCGSKSRARLTAAAPDLLQALTALLDGHTSSGTFRMEQPSIDKARAAIAKATAR